LRCTFDGGAGLITEQPVDVLQKQWNCSRNDVTKTIGIEIVFNQFEYPIQALLRKRNAAVRFVHAGVNNASSRYAQPIAAAPCAVVCLEGAREEKRIALYCNFPTTTTIDRFVVFTRPR